MKKQGPPAGTLPVKRRCGSIAFYPDFYRTFFVFMEASRLRVSLYAILIFKGQQ